MPLFPQMERVFWFDGELKRRRYPNAARLAEKFEVSGKTAQRDIALLRDRPLAPVEYDPGHRGYYYTADHFELPYLPASQHEVLCLPAARQLPQHTAGGSISRARWIRQQHWHPDQILAEQSDGCLGLTLPVADFREIKMAIMQFGADCEVVAPAALLDEMRAEIDKMTRIYRCRT